MIIMKGDIMAKSNKTKGKKRVIFKSVILIILVTIIGFLLVPLFKGLKFGLDLQGGFEILYKAETIDGSKMNNEKLTATYKTLSKRIDSLGVSEPEIIVEGSDRIRVKLAGVKDPEEARTQLSTVATLSFRDVDDNLLMTSDVLVAGHAKIGQDSTGNPAVSLSVTVSLSVSFGSISCLLAAFALPPFEAYTERFLQVSSHFSRSRSSCWAIIRNMG
jgi:preprotein translocase subunit SecD